MKPIRDIRIKSKLIISYIMVVVLPVLLVGIILTTSMWRMAVQQAIKESSNSVEKIQRNLDDLLQLFMNVSNSIYIDKRLEEVILKRYSGPIELREAYLNFTVFDDFLNQYPQIKSIRIYSNNQTLLDNWQIMRATKDIRATSWYRKALIFNGRAFWSFAYNETRGETYLSLVRVVKNLSGARLGVLIMDIDKEYLTALVRYENFETIIFNDEGYAAAAKDDESIGKKPMQLHWNEGLRNRGEGVYDLEYQDEPSKMIVRTLLFEPTSNEFKIVSIFPIRQITEEARRASSLSFFIIFLSLLLTFTLIFFFTYAFSKRVNQLSREIHQVASGNLDISITADGNDEIGQLSRDLGEMVKSLKALVHEVYEVNIQKNKLDIKQKEIKLRMLASQINPHFLFNALETIRMKAHSNGQKEIAEKVKMLGKILRMSLEAGREPIPLSREIDLVKSYLEIQKFRFGDKLEYSIQSKIDMEEHKVLPFILQPIVENAVIHGVETKNGKGVVKVLIESKLGCLILSVIDNGIGFSEDKLRQVQISMNDQENDNGKSIGLKNVHQRLKLYYGDRYGVKISSKIHKGTTINVILPLGDENRVESIDH